MDIFKVYNKTRFQNLKEEEADIVLETFLNYLISKKPFVTKKQLKNMGNFLMNLSLDDSYLFFQKIAKINKNSEDFKYLTYIHQTLLKVHNHYKIDVYQALCNLCRKHYEENQKYMEENRRREI